MVGGHEDTAGRWLRRFPVPAQASVDLVCFPHAGGGATFFFPFAQAMAGVLDVAALQYPGRQDRLAEPCVDSVEELAELITPVVMPLAAERPLLLFGHSLGGSVAYEVARRMEDEGCPPAGLVVSARRAPRIVRHEGVHKRDDAGVLEELRSLGATDPALLADEEFARMIVPAVRADYRAAETYVATDAPPLDCPIVALLGEDDPKVYLEEVLAWSEYTTAGFSHRLFPGAHFYLIEQAYAVQRELAENELLAAGVAQAR